MDHDTASSVLSIHRRPKASSSIRVIETDDMKSKKGKTEGGKRSSESRDDAVPQTATPNSPGNTNHQSTTSYALDSAAKTKCPNLSLTQLSQQTGKSHDALGARQRTVRSSLSLVRSDPTGALLTRARDTASETMERRCRRAIETRRPVSASFP